MLGCKSIALTIFFFASSSFPYKDGTLQNDLLNMIQRVGNIFTGKTPTRAEKIRMWISEKTHSTTNKPIPLPRLTKLLWEQTKEGILT